MSQEAHDSYHDDGEGSCWKDSTPPSPPNLPPPPTNAADKTPAKSKNESSDSEPNTPASASQSTPSRRFSDVSNSASPSGGAINNDTGDYPPTWGVYGYLTESQDAILNQFIKTVPPESLEKAKFTVETKEQVSLRFLRARQFDLNKAMAMLQECVLRRKESKSEYWGTIASDDCALCDVAALKNWYPHTQRGFDKFNRPLFWEHTGNLSIKGIMQMTTTENLINYHWYTMERDVNDAFIAAAEKIAAAKRVKATIATSDSVGDDAKGDDEPLQNVSTCVVLDLNGFGMGHATQKLLDQVKAYVAIDNICYPETLGKMFVVNAPWLAVTTWGLIKTWLDPRTQAKIEIFGSVTPDVTARLLTVIPEETLPKSLGGKGDEVFIKKEHADLVTVPRGGKFSYSITVPPGKGVSVDSYISEGALEIEVTCTVSKTSPSSPSPPLSPSSCPSPSPSTSPSKPTPSTSKIPFSTFPCKELISPKADSSPERRLLRFAPADTERVVTATWNNVSSKWQGRSLTYVFTLI